MLNDQFVIAPVPVYRILKLLNNHKPRLIAIDRNKKNKDHKTTLPSFIKQTTDSIPILINGK